MAVLNDANVTLSYYMGFGLIDNALPAVVGPGLEYGGVSFGRLKIDLSDSRIDIGSNFASYSDFGTSRFVFQFTGAAPIAGVALAPNNGALGVTAADISFTADSITIDTRPGFYVDGAAGLQHLVLAVSTIVYPPPEPPAPPPPPPSKAPVVNAQFSNLLRFQSHGTFPALPATVTTPAGQVLPNPLLEQQKIVASLIAQVDAGSLPLQQALDRLVDLADGSTAAAVLSYQFFTGRAPTRAGVDYLVSSPLNETDLNDGFYAGMSLENRYINFAVNLGTQGEGRAAFLAGYGALGLSDATAKAYQEIFGAAPDARKLADILTPERTAYLASLGGDAMGTKAAMVGWLLAEAAKSDLGPYAVMNENFLYDLADGTAAYGADLHIYLNAGPKAVGLVGVA